MQFTKQIIVVESSAFNAGEEVEHIKLIVGDTSGVIFHLSLGQARSLAKSLVEQVHRLEVANSMRKAKLEQSYSLSNGVKSVMVLSAHRPMSPQPADLNRTP